VRRERETRHDRIPTTTPKWTLLSGGHFSNPASGLRTRWRFRILAAPCRRRRSGERRRSGRYVTLGANGPLQLLSASWRLIARLQKFGDVFRRRSACSVAKMCCPAPRQAGGRAASAPSRADTAEIADINDLFVEG
jgi:hypothetical protein